MTHRALAAVTLEHLPDDTIGQSATSGRDGDPRHLVSVDLRYFPSDGDENSDGDLVRVGVAPQRWDGAKACGDHDPSKGCVGLTTDVDGAELELRWFEEEPEEDPGGVQVTLSRDNGETATVGYSGAPITDDPRDLDLPISVDDMVALLEDPRLRSRITAEVIALGEGLESWEGGEPNPDRSQLVANTNHGIAYAFALQSGQPDRFAGILESRLQAEFGDRAIGGRVVERRGQIVYDVFAAPVPPEWMTDQPCTSPELVQHCVSTEGDLGTLVFAWKHDPHAGRLTDAPLDESKVGWAWMISLRESEVVAVRMRAPLMPAEESAAMTFAAWPSISGMLDTPDTNLSIWCEKEHLAFEEAPDPDQLPIRILD